MAIRMPLINHAKQIFRWATLAGNRSASMMTADVPKGYLAVYVGKEEKKRFVIPILFLSQPSFQDLLRQTEEEFGFNHPTGGLTIPCGEDIFMDLTSRLN